MPRDLSDLNSIDRVLHEPARLMIAALLFSVEGADFLHLLSETGLTRGNLSSHLSMLERSGYLTIEKSFRGKVPHTACRLTPTGRKAFASYRRSLKAISKKLGG
jgi:DNA-binding transcriptional ArsR family regulator